MCWHCAWWFYSDWFIFGPSGNAGGAPTIVTSTTYKAKFMIHSRRCVWDIKYLNTVFKIGRIIKNWSEISHTAERKCIRWTTKASRQLHTTLTATSTLLQLVWVHGVGSHPLIPYERVPAPWQHETYCTFPEWCWSIVMLTFQLNFESFLRNTPIPATFPLCCEFDNCNAIMSSKQIPSSWLAVVRALKWVGGIFVGPILNWLIVDICSCT